MQQFIYEIRSMYDMIKYSKRFCHVLLNLYSSVTQVLPKQMKFA